MIDGKSFNIEIEGNDVLVVQTNGPHGDKSRAFGRIYMGEEDVLRAHRGFVSPEDDVEDLVVGEFSGPHAFVNALEAIMEEYDELDMANFFE